MAAAWKGAAEPEDGVCRGHSGQFRDTCKSPVCAGTGEGFLMHPLESSLPAPAPAAPALIPEDVETGILAMDGVKSVDI